MRKSACMLMIFYDYLLNIDVMFDLLQISGLRFVLLVGEEIVNFVVHC